mgnify:CR=1 FL=1
MQPSHIKILEALKKRPLSKEELIEATGYSYDGIRGRISELRKLGYDIQLKEVPVTITVKKYVLTPRNKLLEYIESNNLYNMQLNVKHLARAINEPLETTKHLIAKLFSDPKIHITQLTSDTIIIRNK